ncbi:hypothetical protein K7432_003052 [Basidiobolus ranarum]|uniref:Uncharacterized protein n=1 Tax=Basidiobolus ranarum TaxID=34480 RepID=A0ABR2W6U7_9FUNG
MEKSKDFDNNKNRLLYDLTVVAEWDPEEEEAGELSSQNYLNGTNYSQGWFQYLTSHLARTFDGLVISTTVPPVLIQELVKLKNDWQLSTSPNAQQLAIYQESKLEIRFLKGFVTDNQHLNVANFSTIHAVYHTKKDPFSKWRCITWSPDSHLLAISRSDGSIEVVDKNGQLVLSIQAGTRPTGQVPGTLSTETSESNTSEDAEGNQFFIEPVAQLFLFDSTFWNQEAIQFEGAAYRYQLVSITYDGTLRSYLFNYFTEESQLEKIQIPLNYRKNLGSSYPKEGVSDSGIFTPFHKYSFKSRYETVVSASIHPLTRVLYIAGKGASKDPIGNDSNQSPESVQCFPSMSGWKMSSTPPFYHHFDGDVIDESITNDSNLKMQDEPEEVGFVTKIQNIVSTLRKRKKSFIDEVVRCVTISPDGSHLLSLDFLGTLKVWKILEDSNVDLIHHWKREELTYFARPGTHKNLTFSEFQEKLKREPESRTKADPVNPTLDSGRVVTAQWWDSNSDSIVLGYEHGAMLIFKISNYLNMLGDSPEHLKSNLEISKPLDNRFYLLEHETLMLRARLHRDNKLTYIHPSQNEEVDFEDELETARPLFKHVSSFIGSSLYYITNTFLWNFEGDSKSAKGKYITIPRKCLRLVQFAEIMPIDLLERKVLALEYEDALSIAKIYSLNSDVVYQAQWNAAKVSAKSIAKFLDNIQDRNWVIETCLMRIPDDTEAAKLLLEYGLKETAHVLEVLSQFQDDFSQLSSEQLLQCRYRVAFLKYLDRLKTMVEIMDTVEKPSKNQANSTNSADGNEYSKANEEQLVEEGSFAEDFIYFREVNIIEQALQYAAIEKYSPLKILFTRHGSELLPYRFAILNQIPEIADPLSYRDFLPKVNTEKDEENLWPDQAWRDKDPVENPSLLAQLDISSEETSNQGISFPHDKVEYPASGVTISNWYISRAHDIDNVSGQVHHAYQLIQAGDENGVGGLRDLKDNLHTLSQLVYECYPDSPEVCLTITLESFEKLTPKEVVELILRETNEHRIVGDIRAFVIPYLKNQCDHSDDQSVHDPMSILYDYILELSVSHLDWCYLAFNDSKPTLLDSDRIIASDLLLCQLALACLYGSKSTNQWKLMNQIFECLPDFEIDIDGARSLAIPSESKFSELSSQEYFGLFKEMNEKDIQSIINKLEIHLNASDILERYDIPITLGWYLDSEGSYPIQKQLLVRIARHASGGVDTMGSKFENEDEWTLLLEAMIDLHNNGVLGEISTEEIYKEFLSGLLSCGGFRLARDLLLPHDKSPPLPASVAEELVINVAREFFDNAESGSMNGGFMKMAYDCLKVLPTSPALKEELDLIEATHVLAEYNLQHKPNIPMLPIQIRLAPNRLELIARILDDHPKAYKAPGRILELAHKLGYREDPSAEIKVYALLSRASVKRKDFKAAYAMCDKLMHLGKKIRQTSPTGMLEAREMAWRVCYDLGAISNSIGLNRRIQLLSFASSICPKEDIYTVIKLWKALKTQQDVTSLKEQLQVQSMSNESEFNLNEAIDELHHLIPEDNRQTDSSNDRYEFYWKPVTSPVPTKTSPYDISSDSDSCYDPKNAVLGMIYRLACMRQIDEHQPATTATELDPVLLDLAQGNFKGQVPLSLSYLLTLRNPSEAREFFDSLESTSHNELVACYYYILYSLPYLSNPVESTKFPPYHKYSPDDIMKISTSMEKSFDELEANKTLPSGLLESIRHFSELINIRKKEKILEEFTGQVEIGQEIGFFRLELLLKDTWKYTVC